MNFSRSKTRIGVAAGIVAGSAALVAGLGPAQSLLPIASARGADDHPTSTTVDDHGVDAPTTAPGAGAPSAPGTTRVVQAAGAGSVTVAVSANRLDVLAATPAPGWRAEVEVASGREVEVDFRRGGDRVQVNLEIEDGAVRERIRIRDDAGTDVRIENGVVVRAEEPGEDRADDDDSPGVDNSGPGSANSDDAVDSSGRGGADDPAGDDHGVDDHGGHGADDPAGVDDHGGHGADDPATDDHGGR
ncbi:MAG TPA: hypothetical protein VKB57_28225 [Acidimicrobiales bacterium]|nr:hypothetical protein [Acidimicrobiales bacterium]